MACLLLLVAAAGGCVTKTETIERPHPAPTPPPSHTVTDNRVTIDPALEHMIHLVRITSTTSPEGFLKIQLNVQSLSDVPVEFFYHVDWYDETGEPLRMANTVPMDWMLLQHETSFLAATAPTPSAKSFHVTFSSAK